MKIFQKGFNFGQDGPGNRSIYHVAGCNMHCLWCSNPEGMKAESEYKEYTPDELVHEAIRCKPMFFSGGGVTFTGGYSERTGEKLMECEDCDLTNIREVFYRTLDKVCDNMVKAANGASAALAELRVPFLSCVMGGLEYGTDMRDTKKREQNTTAAAVWFTDLPSLRIRLSQ